ncbi:MAG: hypothetical protein RLZZ555_1082 [Pseudomonadota bacterium]|jgi:hypothetical protein
MQSLTIVWQRLLDEQRDTCPRCQGTGESLRRAVERLRTVLEPLGVQPVLECRSLDQQDFLQQPAESNRIWIDGRPLEAWLGAQTGASPCCEACGDQDCRTLEVEGQSYEVIPEELLVRAGLKAGIGLLEPVSTSSNPAGGDCRSSNCGSGGCCY